MDKSDSSFKGAQPIRVLQRLIPLKLENTCPGFSELTRSALENQYLNLGLQYHYGNTRAESPFVRYSAIHFNESFLSYIWCICYCLYALHKTGIDIRQRKDEREVDENIGEILNLFWYAVSLTVEYSDWDKEKLPNPELYSLEQQQTIEIVNKFFFVAINYILCHEFAHVEYEHNSKADNGDLGFSINIEKEADNRALELILAGVTSTTLQGTSLGIVCAISSYFLFNRYTVSSKRTHPDTDARLHDVLLHLDPDPSSPVWELAYLGYMLWDMAFNKNFTQPVITTTNKGLYYHIYEQIQNEKRNL